MKSKGTLHEDGTESVVQFEWSALMPDRQRNILYLGLGAVTVSAALYSLAQFQLIDLGAFSVPVLAAFFGGLFAMYYAWNESKRYYL